LSLLPAGLAQKAKKFEAVNLAKEKDATKFTMNICFAYTSRWEIGRAITLALKTGNITDERIRANLLIDRPDIVVRTSGEYRLSDFLLLQVIPPRCFFPD
jgi:undecaprenyl diphosphate synthase